MSSAAHSMECRQGDKIETICRELGTVNKALFLGNGRPSVMAQMEVLRDQMQKLCWLVGITCAAVLGQIVAALAQHMAGK